MKICKIGYIAMGVILAFGSIFTETYGLSEVNLEIYDTAVSLDGMVQNIGFQDFSLKDYKVRFYDGKQDYVVQKNEEEITSIMKEDAVLDVFVGTTMEVDGENQVLLPTYEQFTSLFDVLDAAGTVSQGMSGNTEGTMAFTEDSYSENSHVATIWHEAFHAWQYTNWKAEIDALMKRVNIAEGESREDVIVEEADSDKKMVTAFEDEMELLYKAYETEDMAEKKKLVLQALSIEAEREQKLSDSVNAMEYYLDNLEGSAMYVEGQVYRELEGDDAWKEYYMGEFQYENGSSKYYKRGMLKCLLLNQMMEGWQSQFSGTCGLSQLLEQIV